MRARVAYPCLQLRCDRPSSAQAAAVMMMMTESPLLPRVALLPLVLLVRLRKLE